MFHELPPLPLTDSELEHYLCELARIEAEASADQDCLTYWS